MTKGIREQYHKAGIIYKIDNKYSLPQIILNDELVFSFEQFKVSIDTGLFDKILNKTACNHTRFHKGQVVYSGRDKYDEKMCIYCYSNKKTKQHITLISNFRMYEGDEGCENNELLSYVETSNITIRLIDYENCFSQIKNVDQKLMVMVERKEKCFLINNVIFPFITLDDFIEKVEESQLTLNSLCFICGKITYNNKCTFCKSPLETFKPSHKKPNPYNFLTKLKLAHKIKSI
jgi:hypothetical protein